MWTGLRNPTGVICDDNNCVDQLSWHSDGSFYDKHVAGSIVKMQFGNLCVTYQGPARWIGDSNCSAERSYVCEFKCPEMAGAQHILCKIVESQLRNTINELEHQNKS